MAPKRSKDELPQACKTLSDAIGKDGDLTADDIKKCDAKLRTRAFTALGSALAVNHPMTYESYKKMNDNEKRTHLCQFLLDPASGGCTGTNETIRSVEDAYSIWFRYMIPY